MSLPKFTSAKIPEGRYRFIVAESPIQRRQPSSSGRDFIKVIFIFRVEMPDGRFRKHTEHIVPWDMKYGDLLMALGGVRDPNGDAHMGDVDEDDLVGKDFYAEIVHQPDRNDPTKTYAKLANIEIPGEGETEELPISTLPDEGEKEPTGEKFNDEPPDEDEDEEEEEADVPLPNGEPLPEDDGEPEDEDDEVPF
jgi:hypothetical protein